MTIVDPDELWPRLEEMGAEEVRKKLALGVFSANTIPLIDEWLTQNSAKSTIEKSHTFYDRAVFWLKNHKVFASIFLVFGLVIGLGAVSDAIDKIITVTQKYSGDEEIKITSTTSTHAYRKPQTLSNMNSSIWISKLNRDYQTRDKILNIDVDWDKQPGGIYDLNSLDLKTIEALLENKFIDPLESQNQSPSVQEFVTYLQSTPQARTHGYAVGPQRKDYRVTIEGVLIKQENISADAKISFFEFCQEADEIVTQRDLWCWWD